VQALESSLQAAESTTQSAAQPQQPLQQSRQQPLGTYSLTHPYPLEQAFQQLLNLDTELPPALVTIWQSYLTETHKQLRLLNTDLLFLQTARQPLTREQRYRQSYSRLTQLLADTQALLQLATPEL
jgi:hypothetical protein